MKSQVMLNKYLANIAIMIFKLHSLHWNMVGKEFVQLHLYTEEVYDELFLYFDAVAELQKMNGVTPDSRLEDYMKNADIKEVPTKAFSIQEVFEYLVADITRLQEQATELRKSLDEEDCFTGVAMMEEHVASYMKRLWFLKSIVA